MEILLHNNFKRNYKKRIVPYSKLRTQVDRRIQLFESDMNNPILKDHSLRGDMKGKRSFSVTKDRRIIYKIERNFYIFLDIGTHDEVYN